MKRNILALIILFCLFLGLTRPIKAVDQIIEVKITEIVEEKEIEFEEERQIYQMLEGVVIKGEELIGETIYIENGQYLTTNLKKYQEKDVVYVSPEKDSQGNNQYFIVDYKRTNVLVKLIFIFLAVTVLVAGKKGISSVVGMIISFGVIFNLLLPGIIEGRNPLLLAISASILIIPLTFYMSHGVNRKTTVAVLATFISLAITGILAVVFTNFTKLTGLVSDEANFVVSEIGNQINLRNLLLAGIIIGALGVLDDVTVSQASIVDELKKTDIRLDKRALFSKAMKIGRDHIASMVNTLMLVYAGASLPLLLLFVNNPHPFWHVVNLEIVAEELVKTLVGSIGLVLAVPITTAMAVFVFDKKILNK